MLIDTIRDAPPAYVAQAVKESHLAAMRLTIESLESVSMMDAPHHDPICRFVDDIFSGKIKRGIINQAPGTGKTVSSVWAAISRGFVVNPRSRFLHTSYSADLVNDNSSKVKDVLGSEEWQYFNPLKMKDDTKAKGLWRTDQGGGMRAVQFGGGATGFRAGQSEGDNFDDELFIVGSPERGFTGMLIVDDPNKAADVSSRKIMAETNRKFNNTFASRLFNEDVPILIIMQRLCAYPHQPGDDLAECGDMSEFLLRGGSGEVWDHLSIPIDVDNSLEYPEEYTHGREYAHNLPDGPVWTYKHSQETIDRLKRADIYTYSAQYAQRPKKRLGDPVIDTSYFQRYVDLPSLKRIELFADTASKTKESNDYSVFLIAGEDHQGNVYFLDMKRGKWKIPQLLSTCRDLWAKWQESSPPAARFNIEDKNSGTFLIQQLEEEIGYASKDIQRNIDKFKRWQGVSGRVSQKRVFIPQNASWVSDFVMEADAFTDDDSHAYDDQIDVMIDAIETLCMIKLPVMKKAKKSTGGW